jgi:hypothetical protein
MKSVKAQIYIYIAADVRLGTTTVVKAVATTAAALRERSKVWAGERRSSAKEHQFLSRGEIHLSLLLRNLQRNSVV